MIVLVVAVAVAVSAVVRGGRGGEVEFDVIQQDIFVHFFYL